MGSAQCERGRQVEVRAAAANLLPRSHSCPQHSFNAQCTTMYHIGTTPRIITTMQYRRCHHAATARAFLMPNTVCITHTRLPHTDQMNIFTSNTQIGSSTNSSVCTIELVQSEAGEELYTEATSVAFLALTSSSSGMSLRPLGSLDPSTGAPCPSHSLLWHVMQPV